MSAIITVTTEPPVDPQTPTLTFYQEFAAEVIEALDRILAILPKLDESEEADTKQARKNLNVSDAFCAAAISAVEQLPELDAAKKLHAEKARNRVQFIEAFRPVDGQVDAVSRRLKHALRTNKSDVATSALHIYRIARAQASDDRSPMIAAHVAAMKKALGRRLPTKAEREERKAARLKAAVDGALAQKEVKAA